jgi:hypothetical protein
VGKGWDAGTVGKIVGSAHGLGIGNGAQEVADEAIQLGIGDEMGGLLGEQRSAKDARQAYQGLAAAGEAMGTVVSANQFTLDAESGRLQGNKIDVFESCAINGLAKHDCLSPCWLSQLCSSLRL